MSEDLDKFIKDHAPNKGLTGWIMTTFNTLRKRDRTDFKVFIWSLLSYYRKVYGRSEVLDSINYWIERDLSMEKEEQEFADDLMKRLRQKYRKH